MKCIFLFFALSLLTSGCTFGDESSNDDMLHPYEDHWRFKRQSSVKITQKIVNISEYETWSAHNSSAYIPVANTSYFVADIRPFHRYVSDTHVYGHQTVINNPLKTVSFLETSRNGCSRKTQATVVEAARKYNCIVAQNGGYFNTKTLSCYGNVVSNGKFIQTSDIHNVHFGLNSAGSIITGYLTKADARMMNFTQLIGGVIWLVRNGTSFVEESLKLEDNAEETGTLKYFADVQSARTAIGHDKYGHVVLVQVDGQTKTRGPDLFGFAKFLIDELGLVNAINLDGGGSATLVLNGSLASYPSDHCKNNPKFRCHRKVSTMICVHRAICGPDCQHGSCQDGRCICDLNWDGDICDILKCSVNNCTGNGNCTKVGCRCHRGWHGDRCNIPCEQGSFGFNCSQICRCEHHSHCDRKDGTCHCLPGYEGALCDEKCPPGKYGSNCSFNCHCSDSCLCDPGTGSCLQRSRVPTLLYQDFVNLTRCVAANFWNMTSQVHETSIGFYLKDDKFILSLLCGTVGILVISLTANFLLLWRNYAKSDDGQIPFSEYCETSESSSGDDVKPNNENRNDSDCDETTFYPNNFGSLWTGLTSKFFRNSETKYQPLGTTDEFLELSEITPLQK